MIINGKDYKLSYTGETLLIYKEEFNKDLLLESQKLTKNFDFVSIFEICWAMAKTNDKDIPNFREFMANVDVSEVLSDTRVIDEMTKTLIKDRTTTKTLKKKGISLMMNH